MTCYYLDLGSASDGFAPREIWFNQSEAQTRSGWWDVISMEFLHSFLWRHFAGSLAESFFTQNYCHVCHTRFAVFFRVQEPAMVLLLNLSYSLPEWKLEPHQVVLNFESADKYLWGDNSNEASLTVLSHGATCFSAFYKLKFWILASFNSERVDINDMVCNEGGSNFRDGDEMLK